MIFSHVAEADRLGAASLGELIRYRTSEIHEAMGALKDELRLLNADVVRLEERSTKEYREALEKRLALKEEELIAHNAMRPPEVPKPGSDPEKQERTATVSRELDRLKVERDLLLALIAGERGQQKELAGLARTVEQAFSRVGNLKRRYSAAEEELSKGLEDLGIDAGEVVELKLDLTPLEEACKLYELLQEGAAKLLDPLDPAGYKAELEEVKKEIETLQTQLDEPGKEYEAYLSALVLWNARRREIEGSEDAVGSVKYLEKLIEDLMRGSNKAARGPPASA